MGADPLDALVLGCGRSGTSIFGELFDAVPGYRSLSEPTLEELADASTHRPADRPALAAKVPQVHVDHLAPPGLPLPLETMLGALRPDAVTFWIVRHPLDAIASLRVGIADGWGHHPRPPDWHGWLDRSVVERSAHHWATINGPGLEALGDRAKVLRFEDLIADPHSFASTVCAEVGGDAEGLEVAAWVARVRDRNDEHFVEAVTSRRRSRPDHTVRVGRWRENLTDDEVAQALPIVADVANARGYDLPV